MIYIHVIHLVPKQLIFPPTEKKKMLCSVSSRLRSYFLSSLDTAFITVDTDG